MIVHPSPSSGSALRQRMIEDLTVRGFTAKTQHDDIRYVKAFAGCCHVNSGLVATM
ncbi:MAG TPA: hypothetical protein VFR05_07615 [Terriglobia bacterium]|nr:hypothetical protein [Terriglobia bacterium]